MKSILTKNAAILMIACTGALPMLAQPGAWTSLAPMPTARGYVTGAELDGKIYVFGGALDPNTSTDVVEMYDISAGTWTTKHKLPEKMCCMAAATLGDKIYIIGGAATYNDFPWTKVYSYVPALDTFVAIQNLPTARAFHSVVVLDGEIYIIGGLGMTGAVTGSVIKFNPDNSAGWKNMASLITPRFLSSAEVVDGKIYLIGGAVSPSPPYGILKTTEVFDTLAGYWYTLNAELESERFMHGSGVANGNLYVFGGIFSNSELTSVERLAVTAGEDSWSFDTPMTSGRRVFASVEANGKIYAAGGISQSVLQNKLEVFDPLINAVDERGDAKEEPLLQNYPNPFAGQTAISYKVSMPGNVTITLHDMTGKTIKTLVNGWFFPGSYSVKINAGDLESGIYFYSLKTERGETCTKKMTVLK